VPVNWLGLIVGALLGTVVMTIVMEAGQALHLTRLSLPLCLGAMVTEHRAWIKIFGFFLHFINGLVFAAGYGLLFLALRRSDWWLGALAGGLHGTFALVVLMPLVQDVHHRMAAEDQGPDPTPMLQPPGFLALNYGVQTPVLTIAAHVLYGTILAAFASLPSR